MWWSLPLGNPVSQVVVRILSLLMKAVYNRSRYIILKHVIQNQNNVNSNINVLKLNDFSSYITFYTLGKNGESEFHDMRAYRHLNWHHEVGCFYVFVRNYKDIVFNVVFQIFLNLQHWHLYEYLYISIYMCGCFCITYVGKKNSK